MPHAPGAAPTRRSPRVASRAALAIVVLVTAIGLGGCGTRANGILDDTTTLDAAGVSVLRTQVLATLPHDTGAFTQGLEIAGDTLWEGTGRRGESRLRALDPVTGAVRRTIDLPPEVFGEGITVAPTGLWQLTWTEGVVYVRDPVTGVVRRTAHLDREGWGICHDAGGLVTSDGSDELVVRDPVTFAPLRSVRVHVAGRPVTALNELECTRDGIWANVYRTDHLVRVDPADGRVTAVVDAGGLLTFTQRLDADVLNGIAAVPGTDEYLITGKLWPTLFRVRFVPAS